MTRPEVDTTANRRRCRGAFSSRVSAVAASVALILVSIGVGSPETRAAVVLPDTTTSAEARAGLTSAAAVPVLPAADPVAGDASSGVTLPADEAPHHDPVEWWYFSGHLLGVDKAGHPHCYGFELVTFQYLGIAPVPVYIGNFAVTDLTRKSFHYGAKEDSYSVPTTRDSFLLHTGSWTMSGGSGRDTLHASVAGYTLNLHLQTTQPAVLEGAKGVVPFGPFGSSRYYSWTSLRSTGTMVDHGVAVTVTGISWMDHQWGAFDFASGAGWDWFSVQLTNRQEYMLYFIRNQAGRIVQTLGTRATPTRTTHLQSKAVSEKSTGSWHSRVTSITYPSGWRLTVPGGDLIVTPDLRNQELDLQQLEGVVYWEGDVSLHGQIDGHAVTGVGYTEINPPGQI
jgi:predicted secreted hydrolase